MFEWLNLLRSELTKCGVELSATRDSFEELLSRHYSQLTAEWEFSFSQLKKFLVNGAIAFGLALLTLAGLLSTGIIILARILEVSPFHVLLVITTLGLATVIISIVSLLGQFRSFKTSLIPKQSLEDISSTIRGDLPRVNKDTPDKTELLEKHEGVFDAARNLKRSWSHLKTSLFAVLKLGKMPMQMLTFISISGAAYNYFFRSKSNMDSGKFSSMGLGASLMKLTDGVSRITRRSPGVDTNFATPELNHSNRHTPVSPKSTVGSVVSELFSQIIISLLLEAFVKPRVTASEHRKK